MTSCPDCKTSPVNGGKCRSCYNNYMREYTLARYHRRREEAIAQMGGVCVDCGETERLEFDHVDRTQKTLDVSKVLTHSWEKINAELEKCVLRCGPCHLAKSNREGDIGTVGHGEGRTGKRNCRCELCGPLKNAYMRELKKAANLAKQHSPLV